jgi:O-antigen ligase
MRHLRERLKATARATVVGAVVLSPWLFGSAEPWAYLFISLLVGVGVAAWLLSLLCDAEPEVRAPGLTLVLLGLMALVLLQTVPLPYSVVKVVSPLAAEAQVTQAKAFAETGMGEFLPGPSGDEVTKATLSASPAATRRSLYLLAAYVGVFLVMANGFSKWSQLRSAATAVAVSGAIMVVFALVQKFSGTRSIYWFHSPRFGGSIFGPFTNRNHFALHMNMLFGVTVGLLLAASRVPEFRALRTWREKVAWLSTGKASRITLLGFAAALMGATVCVSLSRGGMTSLAAALGIVGVLIALRSAVAGRGWVVLSVAFLVVATVVWLGWQPVVERLGTLGKIAKDPMADSRSVATRDTLRIFAASPAFGCSFGSFQYVFPKFQSPRIQFGRWLHAHNDWAQLLAEGGIVGAVLTLIAVGLFVRSLGKQLPRATNGGRLLLGGLIVGLVAVALHSFVDYGLHKPANAFLLATVCGMALAAVHVRGERRKRRTEKRRSDKREGRAERRRQIVGAGVA